MFNLNHIGIVVPALESAVPLWCRLLGYPEDAVEYHEVPTEQVRVAMLKGNITVELLEPNPGAESGLTRFLAKRGPGIHHLCFNNPVPLEDKLAELQQQGISLLDTAPRNGAEGKVFFVHPRSAEGVLLEFVEQRETD